MKITIDNRDWRAIIYKGVENQQCDYKSHMDWNLIGRVGRAKFARHAMALANTQGGYIVIGVSEDESGNPVVYTGMTPKELASFDPSSIGQTINRYADPPIQLDVVRPEVEGKSFVVLVIYPFNNLPHVCTDNCEGELRNGVFYIRTPDARSRIADKSSEIHWLIQRALRNQRHLLGQMLRGILYEGQQLADFNGSVNLTQIKNECRLAAREKIGTNLFKNSIICEIIIHPTYLFKEEEDVASLSEMKETLDSLTAPSINHFPDPNTNNTQLYATNDSWKRHKNDQQEQNFYQEFFQNGLHYSLVVIPVSSQEKVVDYRRILYLITNAILLSEQIFTILDHSDTILSIETNILNTENAILTHLPCSLDTSLFQCFISEIQVQRTRSVADLDSGATAELSIKLMREISERFNLIMKKEDIKFQEKLLSQEINQGLYPLTLSKLI